MLARGFTFTCLLGPSREMNEVSLRVGEKAVRTERTRACTPCAKVVAGL